MHLITQKKHWQKFFIAQIEEQNDEHMSNIRKICCVNPKIPLGAGF